MEPGNPETSPERPPPVWVLILIIITGALLLYASTEIHNRAWERIVETAGEGFLLLGMIEFFFRRRLVDYFSRPSESERLLAVTLGGMLNLAGTLSAQGDLAGARPLQEQVLAAYRQLLGEAHPDTLGQ